MKFNVFLSYIHKGSCGDRSLCDCYEVIHSFGLQLPSGHLQYVGRFKKYDLIFMRAPVAIGVCAFCRISLQLLSGPSDFGEIIPLCCLR